MVRFIRSTWPLAYGCLAWSGGARSHLPHKSCRTASAVNIYCVPIAGLLGELDAVIGEDRVDAIGDGHEQMLEELPRGLAICLFNELGDCEFAGPVNRDEDRTCPPPSERLRCRHERSR